MSQDLVILAPVLARPHRVRPLVENVERITPGARLLFIVDEGDTPEQDAVRDAGGEMLIHGGNYAMKIAAGVQHTCEPLLFIGADDIVFVSGWLKHASAAMVDPIEVVGVNDLLRRRRRDHATHFLITREYAQRPCIDDSPGPLYQGYRHNFVDDELIATARNRGVYTYEKAAIVEHRHWMNGLVADDDTYRLGRVGFHHDRRQFARREPLWAA